MGDFNYPDIDYNTQSTSTSERSHASKFLTKTQDNFLVQNVFEPTRYRPNYSPSKLDYIFTSEDNIVEHLHYEVPIGKSDHVCLTWKFVLEAEQRTVIGNRQFDYWRGDYQAINYELQHVDWNSELVKDSIQDSWLHFKMKLITVMEKYIPRKRAYQKKKKSSWMSSKTKNLLRTRNQAWKKFQLHQSTANYNAYKKIRNKVNRMVRDEKQVHRRKIITSFKDKPKKFHGYMRQTQ